MPIPVRLPPDTEYFRICDVPNLLAGARYPELPPDTPRRVTEIKKYPIDDDLRREWCGNIIPFGVTLTDADWALLNSIWADLPPLHPPIPENEWQPYQDAFDAANIEGWRLDLKHKNDLMDSLMQRRTTAKALLKVLQDAAERRDFSPLCGVSYTPIDCSSGERFLGSWIKTRDLAAFAEANGFAVEIADCGGRDCDGAQAAVREREATRVSGIGKREVLAFDWPLHGTFNQKSLDNALSDVPLWFLPARVSKGAAGKRSALWNPAMIAVCLCEQGHVRKTAMTPFLRRNFPDWLEEWEKHESML